MFTSFFFSFFSSPSHSGQQDGVVCAWDLNSYTLIRQFEPHMERIHSVVLSPDGRRFISCGADMYLKVTEVDSGSELVTVQTDEEPKCMDSDGKKLVNGEQPKAGRQMTRVFDVVLPSGTVALVGSESGVLELWNLAQGERVQSFSRHKGGSARRARGGGGRVCVCRTCLGFGSHIFSSSVTGAIECLCVSRDAKQVLTAGVDGCFTLWQAAS